MKKNNIFQDNLYKTPTRFFMTAGNAEGYSELNSFDSALLHAGIGNVNIIQVSSIIPPNCTEIKPVGLPYGSLIPVAYSTITSDLEHEVISAAVAVAMPIDKTKPGVIMEYSSRGRKQDIELITRRMAEEAMKVRHARIADIKSVSVEHIVKKIGCVIAAVVLLYIRSADTLVV